MKKQLIGFILPLLICVLTPLGAAAGFSMVMTYSPWPIAPGGGMGFTVQVKEDNEPVEGETITWSVSPDDGTASVNPTSSTTDSNGQVSTTLRVGSDASGSYTVTATRGSQSVSGTATVETSDDDDSSDDDSSDDDSSDDDSSDDDSSDDDSSDDDSSDDDSSDDDSSDDDSSDDDSSDDDSSDDDSSDDDSSDDDSSDDDSSDDDSSDDDSSDDDSSDDDSSDDDSSDDDSSDDDSSDDDSSDDDSSDDGSSDDGSSDDGSSNDGSSDDGSSDDDSSDDDSSSGNGNSTAVRQVIPQTLTKVSGDEQRGPAGTALAAPFVVSVLDQNRSAFAGVVVTFSVTAGGGTLSSTTATTDANGQAATTLTLGSDLGTNTVEATVKGLESVTFTAGGYAIPHSLEKVSGDGQEGPASTQLTEPFVVLALDENGAAVAGAVVTFSVTAGGGTLSSTTATTDTNPCTIELSTSSTTVTTDANGRAAIRLTLGSEPGTNTVEATVEGLEPETFTATAAEQAILHSLEKVCGDGQEGTAGILLAEPFVVLVSNEDGAAIAGVGGCIR